MNVTTKDLKGLTRAEARQRLESDGYNELPSQQARPAWAILFEVVKEPMFLLLLACGAVYLFMGEPREAVMLLGFVLVIIGITFIQERRTERALEALRDLSSPRALVIRDGEEVRIAGRDVVRGDLIVLAEGDRVPADAVLRQCLSLMTDESMLTGESAPVRKVAVQGVPPAVQPGGDDLPLVFSGTLVTRGTAVAEAIATGHRTELGKIGKALQNVEPEETYLQTETGRLVRLLAIVGVALCLIVVIAYALTRGNTAATWNQGILAGLTMAMATMPEELPVVLTIFLALGAWRMSRQNVLTRRIPAIETLGAATVLCVDKTGTLTQNVMTVSGLMVGGRVLEVNDASSLPEEFHDLVEYGILASSMNPFDPMEKALQRLGRKCLMNTEHLHDDWSLVREYPLSTELLAISHVWRDPVAGRLVVAAKGAPEAIADLCHLPAGEIEGILRHARDMAAKGLRVLGVASGTNVGDRLPGNQHDMEFTFVGLVGLEDPIRPAAPAAVRECRTAGIRVVMITGDYPGTAVSIAGQIGLESAGGVVTGPELDGMDDTALAARIRDVNIFARVVPEQKLRLVKALKANGEVVAMTGDGVNDAPALKAAHIGIAMGKRGTDVARESASLVLLDDDFSSIVEAVRMGRRIFDNIKKAMAFVFAVHVPIAGLSLIPVFFGHWPLILLPAHVLFLELIIDPSCSVVFEAEGAEADVMRRPPRQPGARLFTLRTVGLSVLQGAFVLLAVLGVFVVARAMGHSEDNARGLTFASLVTANLGLILTNRSWSRTIFSMFKERNAALGWVVGGTAVMLGLVLTVPFLQKLFHFSLVHRFDLLVCLLVGAVSIAWFEAFKWLTARGGGPLRR